MTGSAEICGGHPKKILIADDHELMRDAIRRIIATQGDFFVAETDSAKGCMEKLGESAWDLVILDIHLPGNVGLETLRKIRGMLPSLPVLVVTGLDEKAYGVQAFRSGANGYYCKTHGLEAFVKAVSAVLNGRNYITESLAQFIAQSFQRGGKEDLHCMLTKREWEVMTRLVRGHALFRIAAELSISYKTVGTYRERILRKLGLKSTAALCHYCLSQNLL